MKTLISTLTISAALLAPVATFAATASAQATPVPAKVAAAPAAPVIARPAVVKPPAQKTGFGKQANDDGLSRIQEQARQLGANY